jgi:serine/threonine protein kinase
MGNCLQSLNNANQGFQMIPFVSLNVKDREKTKKHNKAKSEEKIKNSKKVTIEDFKFLKMLGKGSFGKVFLVEKKDTSKNFLFIKLKSISDKLYSMKSIRKPALKKPATKINNKTERIILEKICSPFLVKLKYAFQSETKLFLVMDYVEGGK